MRCPKCGGDTTVTDSSFSSSTNTFYRKRKCLACGESMTTAEMQIEVTDDIRHECYLNSRQYAYRQTHRGPKRRNVAVICLETGDVYESGSAAAKALGISRSSITKCCKGLHRTCGGYHWKYYDDYKRSNKK